MRSIILKSWLKYSREFAWRKRPTPYKLMIAEFMLQRTKANQVEPVYKKFLKQYPTILHLSRSRTLGVRKYTDQLGLHWRASHIRESAKYIVKKLKGAYPKTQQKLKDIPGVGDYVAGAICAVCFNNADYVIDSNIARLINRYYNLGFSGEIRRKKVIIEKAKKLFKVKDQKNLLFAILDFTALICKPTKPICFECPVKKSCKFQDKTIKPK